MPETAVLFIHALTGLHPGTGTALGVVDLPVQRERHTQWPTIPGSSLKGVLRECCRRKTSEDDPELLAVFGPKPGAAHDHAGALGLTDARLLAFPVRSLRGVFAWVTCPGVLDRLRRDLGLTGSAAGIKAPPDLGTGEAACADGNALLVDGEHLVLEEFEFTRKPNADAGATADWLAEHATDDTGTQSRIRSHLVVLNDDDFTHFARHATEVTARIGLDYESKTVKTGALFYEEFLPAETLFYSLAIAEESRRKDTKLSARDVVGFVRGHMPPLLQIGGDETIGKGLCAVRLVNGDGADR